LLELDYNFPIVLSAHEAKLDGKLKYICPPGMSGSYISISVPDDSVIAVINKPFNFEIIPSPDRVKRKEAYECKWGKVK
jgi:hypothetical protein